MAPTDPSPPLFALLALLDVEVEVLRRFEFDSLNALALRKAALLDALIAAPSPGPTALESLRTSAQRNATLLIAASRGVQSARRRLVDLRRAAAPQTYDSRGRRNGLGLAPGTVERRA